MNLILKRGVDHGTDTTARNGVSLGSIYALIALGYTMVYGIVKLINFAHGDVFMVGAFIGFYSITILDLWFIPLY